MPDVVDWPAVADPHAALRRAVRALRDGGVVALPTDTSYSLTASACAPEAVARLGAAPPDLEVAVRGEADAADWAPQMGPLGRRLARRLWPGPVTLACAGADAGLAGRLPEAVRRHLCPDGRLRLRAPAHEAVREVLRRLPVPLLMAPGGPDAADLVIDDGPSRCPQPATVVELTGGGWRVLRPGAVTEEHLRQQGACVVVFVCTGNTCRSPLAEALCKKRLADALGCEAHDLPARGLHVLSAGLAAAPGAPAADEAVEVARAYGADLTGHVSQPLAPELAAQADFLVVMTRGHRRALLDHYPRLGAAPRLLDPEGDVADPIGQGPEVYEECARQIWARLEALAEEVRPGGGGGEP